MRTGAAEESKTIITQEIDRSTNQPDILQIADGPTIGRPKSLLRLVGAGEKYDLDLLVLISLPDAALRAISPDGEYFLLAELRPFPAFATKSVIVLREKFRLKAGIYVDDILSGPIVIHPSEAHAEEHCHSWDSVGRDGR